MSRISIFLILCTGLIYSCGPSGTERLPILGFSQIDGNDTIHHVIRDFRLLDQDSIYVTNETFASQAYVADFFFTSCPTVCPKIKQQTLRIMERFADEDRLSFLSHSIDHRRDSVPVLASYARKLEANDRWHFVEVPEEILDSLALNYISVAHEDEDAPGGYNHSSYLLLVDQNRHIRSVCVGTDPEDVDRFMEDIQFLLDEEYSM